MPKNNKNNVTIPECGDMANDTQKSINALKKVYCQNITDAENNLEKLKIAFESTEEIYKSRERRLLATRENYQLYVNTEVSFGSQLMQANDQIKAGVGNFKTWDDALAGNLKEIFNKVKTLKSLVEDLWKSKAALLASKSHDTCSDAEWSAISPKTDGDEDDPCNEIDQAISDLFTMPDVLSQDVNAIFKSSSDIIGIQKFINTGSIVELQQTLYTSAQEFDAVLVATIASRKTELDSYQAELKTALAARTTAILALYDERSTFAGINTTLRKICCPKCGCVDDDGDGGRLDKCFDEICKICGEVKGAFVPPPQTLTSNDQHQ
ncbi:hypothetical protein QEG73_05135 [Chitinophagaceae bacterium 26-R-25]|nr:hypothetical protein [Chitinophagaceae bacterium 26-R-25]